MYRSAGCYYVQVSRMLLCTFNREMFSVQGFARTTGFQIHILIRGLQAADDVDSGAAASAGVIAAIRNNDKHDKGASSSGLWIVVYAQDWTFQVVYGRYRQCMDVTGSVWKFQV